MKKVLLVTVIAILSLNSAQAQEPGFKLGAFVGLPIGDAGDSHTLNAGVDAAYLFNIVDSFQVGPATGYSHSFGDSIDTGFGSFEVEDFQFIPIAAAARFNVTEAFFFGADIGYAVVISDGDGGIYYRPRAGFNFGPLSAFVSYTGISIPETTTTMGDVEVTSGGGSFSSVNLGVEFSL